MSTVDDFQEHISDDGWWLFLAPGDNVVVEVTPGADPSDTSLAEELSPRRSRGLSGQIPLLGEISASVEYFSSDDDLETPTTVLELPFDGYQIDLTIGDILTKKRKRDDAVHTLYHVDQHRSAVGSRSSSSHQHSDLLVLLFGTLPSGKYALEGVRMFLPISALRFCSCRVDPVPENMVFVLELLPRDFADAAESFIEDQRRQRSARKKIKFNAGTMEQVHLFFGKCALVAMVYIYCPLSRLSCGDWSRAPPAFRVAHAETQFDATLRSDDVESLDFNQLKAEVKQRGGNASGKKKDLVSKLKQLLTVQEGASSSTNGSNFTAPPMSPFAPPPSPSPRKPKSALKVRPSVNDSAEVEPVPAAIEAVAIKLDFAAGPVTPAKAGLESQDEGPKSPTKLPATPAAPTPSKRARRSSLALVGLPDRRSSRRRSIDPAGDED